MMCVHQSCPNYVIINGFTGVSIYRTIISPCNHSVGISRYKYLFGEKTHFYIYILTSVKAYVFTYLHLLPHQE